MSNDETAMMVDGNAFHLPHATRRGRTRAAMHRLAGYMALASVVSLLLGVVLAPLVTPQPGSGGAPTPGGAPPRATVPGDPCPAGSPLASFDVVALNVDIPLNRFGDHVPEGRMYALREDVPRIRAAEAEQRPETGLADDPIQPLVIRAHLGDCVEFQFTNLLRDGERASLHVHGVSYTPDGAGGAMGFNADSSIAPGETIRFRVFVFDSPDGESARYFHSHAAPREQTHFGLFGGLIAEPPGARFLNPRTGEPQRSGWDAIIEDPSGRDFREFVPIYHEWGDETFQPLDFEDNELPLVDPFTDVYRPGGRAISYRSEPFFTRARFIEETIGLDPQAANYPSSYSHGDPAQPIARAYLGDPLKWRIVHGGGEVPHVHHLHGGGVRWPFQPVTGETRFGLGLSKGPDLLPTGRSILLDSQTIVPGETYTAQNECSAGGCQQSPGDFFFHCHVNEHYPAGMWGILRVHNTQQPDLAELPDREDTMQPAVTSVDLIGTRLPNGTLLTADTLAPWVELFLPPRGVPRDFLDSSVMDWAVEQTLGGPLYLNEPESPVVHPNFASPAPGERLPILFDPVTKRPAYPLLRPHPGERPPFAPGPHGPTAYLHNRDDGNFAQDRICPAGRPTRHFDSRVVEIPIPVTDEGEVLDEGIAFVLASEEELFRSGERLIEPLVVRANVGDCVRVTLANALPELERHGESSVNLHPHFGQFDIQASDGAVVGFNFEQAIRPFEAVGTRLAAPASPGDSAIEVEDASRFHEGAYLALGVDGPRFEVRRIARIEGSVIHLVEPLAVAHPAGAAVTDEFVNYEIYFDFQAGLVYFHDHVSHLHVAAGQFGAYIAEPPNSTYRDPNSGITTPPPAAPLCHHAHAHHCTLTGTEADILTDFPVATSEPGEPFREKVVVFGDNVPLRRGQRGVTWTNYRAEPLDDREGSSGDRSLAFSSVVHGDPFTGVTSGYVGDLLVMRVLAGSTNHMHSFVMPDHLFPVERFDNESLLTESYTVGQSERFDLVSRVGALAQLPGDYLWYNGLNLHLEEGNWGLVRAHDRLRDDVIPLPGNRPPAGVGFPESMGHPADAPRSAPDPGNPCPPTARLERFNVSLVEVDLTFNARRGIRESNQRVFVLDEDLPRVLASNGTGIEPLVMHVHEGSCVEVRFTNRLDDERASFHVSLLDKDVRRSSGITAGFNFDQSVPPGTARTYRYFARAPDGVETAIIADFAEPTESWAEGAFGAVSIVPANATVVDSRTGARTTRGADVTLLFPGGGGRRVFTVLFQDEDPRIGMDEMPYDRFVDGIAAINYRTEPLLDRVEVNESHGFPFSSFVHGDPETPIFLAHAGDPVTFHYAMVRGEQAHAFTVDGHEWPFNPTENRSIALNTRALMPVEDATARLIGGAGGPQRMPGDYLYGDHRLPFTQAGMWGIFRVLPLNSTAPLVRIPASPGGGGGDGGGDGGGGGGGGGGTSPGTPPNGTQPCTCRPPAKPPGGTHPEVPGRPGFPVHFTLEFRNLLNATQARLQLRVEAPPGWLVRVDPTPIPPVPAGGRVNLSVDAIVPAGAAGTAPLRFLMILDDGTAQDLGVTPVRVTPAPGGSAGGATPGTPRQPDGGGGEAGESGIPGLPALAAVGALAAAALLRRRKR